MKTRIIECNEVQKVFFSGNKKPIQKTGSHFYDHMMNHIPFKLEYMPNKMVLSFFIG